MDNVTPKQKEKLQKLVNLMKEGNLGVLKYLAEIEDKVDIVSPNIVDILSKVKGEKGEDYVMTEEDKSELLLSLRSLFDDEKLIEEVFSKIEIPFEDIAKKASTYIKVPKPEKVDYKRIKSEVLSDIVIPVPENGKDADESAIIEKVEEHIEKNLPQFGERIRDGLELLEGDDRLDASAIKGLKKLIKRVSGDGHVTFHGGGGVGAIKGIVAGTNITVDNTNPQYPIIASTGGGGGGSLTTIPVTGTINDSNLIFTSATQPDVLVINGGLYQQTGGAITWTYVAGTITLSSPVGTNGSIYGLTTSSVVTGVFVDNEFVSGSGTAFVLAQTPVSGSVHVYGMGQRLYLGADYTIVGKNITTTNTWSLGQILADYRT